MVDRDCSGINIQQDDTDLILRASGTGQGARRFVLNRAATLEASGDGNHAELIEELVA